ncbi:ABC transporter ATP-binding protein [Nitrospina gracilis]|uniref:ABC transporter ATP-binding protein n=1 Tax=Nitrospina gracilis TaxID=35801 RepID=UPI001F37D927|nr:ABC transporter ATP-binding protein [Nitrospina gracilis]MCF8719903.1 ABC-2 type transport system ATP-binding protein [Nitrospina gracilis Nb-211]
MTNHDTKDAVVVHGLVKRFGDFTAVDGISFRVKQGEVFGFLGPNGSGKSTTIRMLCGILLPTSGTGRIAGLDILTQTEQIKFHIGYMSQKFSLYETLTVEENIDFFSGVYQIPEKKKRERKQWVVEMAHLQDHRHVLTRILPGGLKQRLALGCAILHEPEVLFLDEPTSGVDPINRRRFWDLIYQLSGQGVTVFVTTHYMDEAENCNRLGLIYRGQLVATGTPEELKANELEGQVWEVHCDRPQSAMLALEGQPGIRDVSLFGLSLHVVAEEDPSMPQRIQDSLQKVNCRVERVEKIPPALEDIFVTLIQSRERALQAQQEVER